MSFLGDVTKLSSGSLAAQAVTIAAIPVLTRIFSPEAFGIAGLFATISGIIGGLACLRYDLAIVLPDGDNKAAKLYIGALMLVFCTALFVALFLLVAADEILEVFKVQQIGSFLWLLPPMIFITGINFASINWSIRKKRFGQLSVSRMINSGGKVAVQLFMGLLGWVTCGTLILGATAGQAMATVLLSLSIWIKDGQLIKKSFHPVQIWCILRRYAEFPKYVIWSGLLVDASLKLPIFIIAYFFTPKELGFFVLIQSILKLPLEIIGQSISNVFFQRAAELKNDIHHLAAQVVNLFTFLNTVIIPPALFLAVLGSDIVTLLFGANWGEAGIYLQIMVFSVIVEFVTAPLGPLFNVLEKQKEALRFNLLLMMVRLLTLVAGGITGNIRLTIGLYVLGDIIARSIKFQYIFRQVCLSLKKMTRISIGKLLLVFPFLIGLIFLNHSFNFHPFVVILVAIVFTAVYYGINLYKTGTGEWGRSRLSEYLRSMASDYSHR